MFKAFPSGRGQDWIDVLRDYADEPYMDYATSHMPTFRTFLNTGAPLGKLKEGTIRVRPNHGRRHGRIPNRMKGLLDEWFDSRPMSAERLEVVV